MRVRVKGGVAGVQRRQNGCHPSQTSTAHPDMQIQRLCKCATPNMPHATATDHTMALSSRQNAPAHARNTSDEVSDAVKRVGSNADKNRQWCRRLVVVRDASGLFRQQCRRLVVVRYASGLFSTHVVVCSSTCLFATSILPVITAPRFALFCDLPTYV